LLEFLGTLFRQAVKTSAADLICNKPAIFCQAKNGSPDQSLADAELAHGRDQTT
jgi:hypothetical protein